VASERSAKEETKQDAAQDGKEDMMTTMVWRERASRGLAKGSMNQHSTVADALFEIIDNPIDYRFGGKLDIRVQVQKTRDLVVVEDVGGEGMDDEGIQDWLNWGSGHPHLARDIGRYHYGGKAATGFLANHIKIIARRAGTPTVWVFEDKEWATRDDWGDYGPPRTLELQKLPGHLAALEPHVGFVRIELRDLNKSRRYRLEDLQFKLANVYRVLLMKGEISITLDGTLIAPLELPESTAFRPVDIDRKLPSGRRLRGRIWRLNRDEVVNSKFIKGGIRTLLNGRLITDGEYFGYYAEGKGLLASLIGELHLDFCIPIPSKNAWVTDSEEWYEVEEAMGEILPPVIKTFREAADKNPVSREEKKRANEVHRQLLEALKLLARQDGLAGEGRDESTALVADKAGRKPAVYLNGHRPEPVGGSHSPMERPTPPPPGAVGTLPRLVERLGKSGGLPPIRPKPMMERALRSGRDVENGSEVIIINTLHPMYRELGGDRAYVAETAILEMFRPYDDPGSLNASDYYGQALQVLNAWYKVVEAEL
jgi:hypothetical protein